MDHQTGRENDEQLLLTAERAAEWLAHLKTNPASDKQAFVRWLRSSPDAVGEMLLAVSTDVVLRQHFRDNPVDIEQLLSAPSDVTSVRDFDPPVIERTVSRKKWWWLGGLGTGLAAVAATLLMQPTFVRDLLHPNEFTTLVGEQRAIELDDGSAIFINTRSSVRVSYSEKSRDVYLNDGQAMFTVAKDAARPFSVHVPSAKTGAEAIIRAIGTKFDVRRQGDSTLVSVAEGTVQVNTKAADARVESALAQLAEKTRVTAGEAVSIVKTGKVSAPAPVNVDDIGAWRQRRLIFVDNTLAEITEEFSRYNRTPQIRVEGDDLRARRLSGVFDADSPEDLLLYLQRDNAIVLDRRGDEIVIRRKSVFVQSRSNDG